MVSIGLKILEVKQNKRVLKILLLSISLDIHTWGSQSISWKDAVQYYFKR